MLDWLKYKWWTLKDYWYQFKCWAWHRYGIYTGRYLPRYTWTDKVEVLPHLMFEVLLRFLEDEKPETYVEWYGSNGHKTIVNGQEVYVMDEMKRLAKWWKEEYNNTEKTDTLWTMAEKHKPIEDFKAITQENYKALDCNESSIGNFLWEPTFASEDDKIIYNGALADIRKFDENMQKELEENMHSLVNIRAHLWC